MRLTAGEYSTAAHNVVCMGAIGWKGEIKPVRKVGKCPLQESNLQLALRRGSLYPFN